MPAGEDSLPADLEGLALGERPKQVTVSTQTGQEDGGADDVEYINGKHPIRPNQPSCPYYGKKGGRCSFGRKCRFNHQPAAVQQQDKQQEPQQEPQHPGPAKACAAAGPSFAAAPAHDRQLLQLPVVNAALSGAALRAWPWRAGRRSFLKGVLAAHIIETACVASTGTAEVTYRLNTAQAGPVLQEAWRHQQGRSTQARQKPYSTLGKLLDGDPYLSIEEDAHKPGCNWVVLDAARLQADYGVAAPGAGVAMLGGIAVLGPAVGGRGVAQGAPFGAYADAGGMGTPPVAVGWGYGAAARAYGAAAKGGGSSSSSHGGGSVYGSSADMRAAAGAGSSGYVLHGSSSSSGGGMDGAHGRLGPVYPLGYYGPAAGPYALSYGAAPAVVSMGGHTAHAAAHNAAAAAGGVAYGQQGRGGSGMGLHAGHRGGARG